MSGARQDFGREPSLSKPPSQAVAGEPSFFEIKMGHKARNFVIVFSIHHVTQSQRVLRSLLVLLLVLLAHGGKERDVGDRASPGKKCIETNDELRAAFEAYLLAGEAAIEDVYGKIADWCVDHVTDFSKLCTTDYNLVGGYDPRGSFNAPLTNWNTSSAVSMELMFYGCSRFNQPVDHFDVKKVKDFSGMFQGSDFNHPLTSWNTKKAESMHVMFLASKFNQSVEHFRIGKVKDMWAMFWGSSFNQNLCAWKDSIGKGTDVGRMFDETACPNSSDPKMRKRRRNGSFSAGPFCFDCSTSAAFLDECTNEVLSKCTCALVEVDTPECANLSSNPDQYTCEGTDDGHHYSCRRVDPEKCARKAVKKKCPDLSRKDKRKVLKRHRQSFASNCS